MIRGTTPTLEFGLPISKESIADAFVSFSQNQKLVIDKPLSACSCEGNKLTVRLEQEDTLKLVADQLTEIQLRVKTTDGEALASQIIKVDTYRIIKDGVI